MTDFRGTVYEQAAYDALDALNSYRPGDVTDLQMIAILNGLDAAGLLLTPERLDAIADTIEAMAIAGDEHGKSALDVAAAVVRHSMPAVTP